MATFDQPNWYRVSVTGLNHDKKRDLISKGWIQSSTYPNRGLFMKGAGESGTSLLSYDVASTMFVTTNTDVNELDSLLSGMTIGGRRKSSKSKKARKSHKSRKSRKYRKSKSHKK
jgi:hypothetical protein